MVCTQNALKFVFRRLREIAAISELAPHEADLYIKTRQEEAAVKIQVTA